MSAEEGKKRVAIEILGEKYVVRSHSSVEHLQEVGNHVNELMTELVEKHPYMSIHKVAILTSLNIASDLISLRKRGKHRKR